MKATLSLLLVLLSVLSFAQNKNGDVLNGLVRTETDSIYAKLVNVRRDFHQNPELAGKEFRTQQTIKKYLADLGIEVEADTYGHSVIGIIKGDKKGKKIAWRAEMDALPNNFPDPVDFKSAVNGVQHGCGHDVHLAVALGIAEILAKNKKALHGTFYIIFQPEEETFVGAKKMIEAGLLTKLQPDEIYSLHVTDLPVGKILVKPNEMFAYQKRLKIEFKNEVSKDQAKALAQKIRSALSRSKGGSKPWEIGQMIDPEVGLTNPESIFKDYLIVDDNNSINLKNDHLFLETYLYETNQLNLQKIIPKVKEIIANEGLSNQLVSVSFSQANPTVMNDEKLTKHAITVLNKIYGNNLIVPDNGQVPFFNDDFAYFQQKVPGVYFFLGGTNLEKGVVAMNHAPGFVVDEECIRVGVRCFSTLMLNCLSNQ